jgi:RNA polymerase sigma-70 factor (ECF subfamily)
MKSSMRKALITHLPALRRYAYGLAGNQADAEDLVQTCVLRAMEREAQWRGENGRAWLFAIMTNLHRNRLRTHRRQPVELAAEPPEVMADTPPPDPLLQNTLMRALTTVQPEARAVLLLVAIEGYTYAETAAILDTPIGTVMSRLSRARRQLSDMLGRKAITPLSI